MSERGAMGAFTVGDWVVYDPGHGRPKEDGEVTKVINDAMVCVRYRGDWTAKASYICDLALGRSALNRVDETTPDPDPTGPKPPESD